MNEQLRGGPQSMYEWIKSVPRQVVIGLIVAAVSGGLLWAYNHLEDRITSEPLTANLSAPHGQASIRPFFELQIGPALASYCREPAWVQWLGETIWDEHCRRIAFEPHTLADMQTRRLPFKESANPVELMRIFIDRHKGCLTMILEGETYRISEPKSSDLIRANGTLVCP